MTTPRSAAERRRDREDERETLRQRTRTANTRTNRGAHAQDDEDEDGAREGAPRGPGDTGSDSGGRRDVARRVNEAISNFLRSAGTARDFEFLVSVVSGITGASLGDSIAVLNRNSAVRDHMQGQASRDVDPINTQPPIPGGGTTGLGQVPPALNREPNPFQATLADLFGDQVQTGAEFSRFANDLLGGTVGPVSSFVRRQFEPARNRFLLNTLLDPSSTSSFTDFLGQAGGTGSGGNFFFGPGQGFRALEQAGGILGQPLDALSVGQQAGVGELTDPQGRGAFAGLAAQRDLARRILARQVDPILRSGFRTSFNRFFDDFIANTDPTLLQNTNFLNTVVGNPQFRSFFQ